MTYIVGHIKPDVDTVSSAVATQYLFEQKDCFGYQNIKAVTSEPVNTETQFVFNKFGIALPPVLKASDVTAEDLFILVDHNEPSQRHEAIQNDSIVEIIDHHTTNLQTPAIYITIKPWGSTCSIVWFLMKQNSIVPTKEIAGIMLSALLSDTVGFRSSTTTDQDRTFANELAHIAKVSDIESFTRELFKTKSNIDTLSPKDIVTKDYKLFTMGAKKVLINQIETVEQSTVLKQKEKLVEAMTEVKKEEGVDYIFCAVSDIFDVNTKMLFTTNEEKSILQKAYEKTPDEKNMIDIGAKISRKKEFVPPIQKIIEGY